MPIKLAKPMKPAIMKCNPLIPSDRHLVTSLYAKFKLVVVLLIGLDMMDKQHKNANIANFVYYGKLEQNEFTVDDREIIGSVFALSQTFHYRCSLEVHVLCIYGINVINEIGKLKGF